jgi:ubiquinone biosynthesis protein UbiJ
MQQALFAVAEPMLNRALAYDFRANSRLKLLENKRFALVLTDINFQLSLASLHGKLVLSSNIEDSDCKVVTKTQHIKTLSDASMLTQLIKRDELELEGDLNTAQGFSDLLVNNQIDWQELLSSYVGDAMAFRIATFMEGLKQTIQHKLVDAKFTQSTLLTDELKVAPTGLEVDGFGSEVSRVQAQVERLEREIQNLRGAV